VGCASFLLAQHIVVVMLNRGMVAMYDIDLQLDVFLRRLAELSMVVEDIDDMVGVYLWISMLYEPEI